MRRLRESKVKGIKPQVDHTPIVPQKDPENIVITHKKELEVRNDPVLFKILEDQSNISFSLIEILQEITKPKEKRVLDCTINRDLSGKMKNIIIEEK